MYPETCLVAHPECSPEVLRAVDKVGGASGMLQYAGESAREEFVVGTGSGMVYRLRKEYTDKKFCPATEHFICPTMKMITVEQIRIALRDLKHVVRVAEDIRDKARGSLEAMLAVGTSPHLPK